MPFDIKAALDAGYTPAQVADYLGPKRGFDVNAARKAGYGDEQIVDYLGQAKSGFAAATSSGFHSAKGAAEKYLGELTGSESLKQSAAENKAKARAEFAPTTEEDVANAKGILPTAGAYLSRKVTEPVGGILGSYGAPIAAAAATPFVAPEALGAAGVAALSAGVGTVAGLPSMAGETLERQEALGQKPDLVSATASGLFKSALMNVTIPGMGAATKGISKALGNSLEAQAQGMAQKVINGELSHEAAVKSLSGYGNQLARNMAINATAGSAMMVGSEAADRVATGESLTSPEAMEAYGHNVQSALELSPIFGALHGLGERGRAKATLADAKDRNETINQVNADRAQRNLDITNIKEDNRAKAEAAFRAADEAQRAAIRAQIKADPNRSILDIINEVTGVNAEPAGNTRQGFVTAFNRPSGRMVSDPVTGIERELTRGELHQILNPDAFPEPPAPELTKQDVLPLASSIEQAHEVNKAGTNQQDLFNPVELAPKQPKPIEAPLTSLPELKQQETLPLENNIGEVRSMQTMGSNQGDFFNPPAMPPLPKLDEGDIKEMGFYKNSPAFKALLGKDPLADAVHIDKVFEANKDLKTLKPEAVKEYRSVVNAYRQAQGPDVSAEPGATGAANQPGVSVPKPRGQRVAKGVAGAAPADVGDVGVSASELGAGKKGKPGPLVEKAKSGNWRDAVDAESDAFKKADILRSIADISKSDKELKDILTRLKSTDPEIGNITWAIEHNPNALISTKARANQFRLDAETESSRLLQNEERATKRKDYEAKSLSRKYDDALEAYNTLAKKPDVTREELQKLDEAVTEVRKAYDKTTYAEQARGRTEGGHTAESLRSELTNEFGEQGIGNLEKRGILNLHDSVEHAPEHIRNAVESDAIGAHSEGVTHLFADRIAKGEGRRGLLHEVGEHYGLKGMLGERIYNNLLDTIGRTAHKDPVIKEAIDHVARNYPELKDNPAQFAREVIARVGESAPTHTLYRRIVAGVKNFLVKMGLMKNLNARDIQDLIQHSLRTAMKRDIEAPKRGVEAGRNDLWDTGNQKQEFTSAKTSINVSKLPATFGKLKAMGVVKEGDVIADVGGGRFDNAVEWANKQGATLHVIDPFNRTQEHNIKAINAVRDGQADKATNNNVLNVIKEPENRARVIRQVENTLKPGGKAYFLTYEGNRSGEGAPSQQNQSFQNNKKTADYLNEVKSIFGNAKMQNGMIVAEKSLVEMAKGPGKRLDGSPLKQPKPYTGRMPESIKRVIDGEGSMWENLGRQLGAFKNKVGTAVVSKAYNIERKALDKGIAGVSSKQQGELRGDRIYQQAQSASALSHSGMQMGGLRLMPSGLVEAFADKENPANMVMIADGFNKLAARAAKEVGNEDTAFDMLSMAWVGPRYENIIRNNERLDGEIANLRATRPEGYGAVVEQLEKQKKYVGDWTKEDRAAAREGEKRYGKELADVRATWNTMRGRLLNFMVETQNMTKELAEEYLDNIDYVPFYRIPAEELVDTNFRPLTGSSLQNAGRQYRFKGSDKQQADPITNMMANVSWMMQKGIQNNAALRLAKLEEQLGEGRWVDAENPAVKGRTVTIYKEGKPKEFILDDVNDMAAFGGNPILQGMVWDVARGFTSFLRHGVTMFPQFVWNQAWEDPIRATFVSGNKAGFASNIANTWKSIYKNQISAEHTAGAEALYRSGVIGQKDVMSERDVERRYSGEDKSGFRKSLFFFERLAQGSDLGARESIYNHAMKELKDEGYDQATAHAVATSRAIQYMPHQQVGNSRTMAYLRAMMPFVNSPIQGYARDIAAARGRIDGVSKEQGQKMLLLRLAKYAAFIGAYAAFRSGDPDYENQTADQRDNNFYIGGTKIPAPQELRSFKAAIERGTRAYVLSAPGADLEGADIGAAILRKNWELVAGLALPVPTAIRPVLEGVTNYNIHTGRPLVGQGLQDREPAMQYNDNTSEIGKLMGSIMNVSPIKVDNFISGYGGYLGQTVEKFSNVLVEGRPAQSVNDWLFVGSLLEPEYGGGPRTETYELADKVARVKSTMKALKDEGRIDELKQYIQENRGYIGGEDSVSRAHQAVTNIRRYQSQITASNMDPDAKRAKLDELKQNELNALANVHELHRKIVEANNAGS